jgi:hypothetical protein
MLRREIALNDFIARLAGSEFDPDRLYFENIRSLYGGDREEYKDAAKLVIELAVKHKVLIERIGFICPNEACGRIIKSYGALQEPHEYLLCTTCQSLEREPCVFESKNLRTITFYQLSKEHKMSEKIGVRTVDYLDEFVVELKKQLESDYGRWGDSWLCQPEGQEKFCIWKFIQYYEASRLRSEPMPWLKIAGYALISWIRENHPEILPKDVACHDPGSFSLIVRDNHPEVCTDVDADWEDYKARHPDVCDKTGAPYRSKEECF